MARQPNIISFDTARETSTRNAGRTNQAYADRRARDSRRTNRRSAEPDAMEEGVSVARRSRRAEGEIASTRNSSRSRRTERNAAAQASEQNERTARKSNDRRDQREQRRRERTKERADRMFAKQVEAKEPAPESGSGTPRAALYEAQMGSSHRKAARMQRSSTAAPQTAKINPAGWFANLNVSPRTLKAFTAVLCVILVGVFLYVPAQQYYQAQREHDKLVAEYEVLEQRNKALSSQNESLGSNAGMEDAVRQKYGYVVGGDQAGVVMGLSDVATDTARDSENIEANVLSSTVKAPEEWYTPFLDAFFGVS